MFYSGQRPTIRLDIKRSRMRKAIHNLIPSAPFNCKPLRAFRPCSAKNGASSTGTLTAGPRR